MADFDIVALGEPLVEMNQTHKGQLQYLQGFGGDTSNAVIAAARQGARCAYLTRVGNDAFGAQFLDLWASEGVDTSGVQRDDDAHTGLYFVQHGPDGHAFSYLRRGSAASLMTPALLDSGLIAMLMPDTCRNWLRSINPLSSKAGVIRLAAEPRRR